MMNKKTIFMVVSLLIIVKIAFGMTYLKIGEIQDKVWLFTSNGINLLTEQDFHILNRLNEQQNERLEYVFWREVEGIITAPRANREKYCNIILTTERIDILIQGGVPFDPKKNECIISQVLADELFGSDNVDGLSIEYGGRVYHIRDVCESLEEGIVLFTTHDFSILDESEKDTPDAEEPILFENITILNNGNASDLAIKDKLENFLGTQLKRLDLKFEFFILQLVYIISMVILLKIIDISLKYKIKTSLVMLIILALGLDVFLAFHFYNIPVDIIPSKLSDQLFWHDLYIMEKENYHQLFSMKRVIPLRNWYKLRIWLMTLIVINDMLLFKLYGLVKVKKQY